MIATLPNQVELDGDGGVDRSIAALNQKIDALTAQIQYLTAQAQLAEQARAERAELMHDVMPIANSAMKLATAELQEVEAYVNPDDLLRLLKKLVRAAPYLETLLDQLGSAMDLVQVATPIGKEAFAKAETVLDEMDRKGYFVFARGGMQIMDNVVTSFTEEDVKKLGDNIVLILSVIKDMTQPEIMNFVHNTLLVAEQEVEKPVDISYPALLSQMRDPAVRRGLALTMRVLHVVGAQAQTNGHGA